MGDMLYEWCWLKLILWAWTFYHDSWLLFFKFFVGAWWTSQSYMNYGVGKSFYALKMWLVFLQVLKEYGMCSVSSIEKRKEKDVFNHFSLSIIGIFGSCGSKIHVHSYWTLDIFSTIHTSFTWKLWKEESKLPFLYLPNNVLWTT